VANIHYQVSHAHCSTPAHDIRTHTWLQTCSMYAYYVILLSCITVNVPYTITIDASRMYAVKNPLVGVLLAALRNVLWKHIISYECMLAEHNSEPVREHTQPSTPGHEIRTHA
jgi:hypothetical protein